MPENREQKSIETNPARDEVAPAPGAAPTGGGDGATPGDLDLEGLDLTVETVEERISPSETNVFDK